MEMRLGDVVSANALLNGSWKKMATREERKFDGVHRRPPTFITLGLSGGSQRAAAFTLQRRLAEGNCTRIRRSFVYRCESDGNPLNGLEVVAMEVKQEVNLTARAEWISDRNQSMLRTGIFVDDEQPTCIASMILSPYTMLDNFLIAVKDRISLPSCVKMNFHIPCSLPFGRSPEQLSDFFPCAPKMVEVVPAADGSDETSSVSSGSHRSRSRSGGRRE